MTVEERRSAFNFCNPFDHVMPGPDGSVDKPDRAHLWGLYSGIAVGTGVAVILTLYYYASLLSGDR